MNKKIPNDYSYADIKIGGVIEFEQIITEEMVKNFAELTGDYNPLHMDEEYAKKTQFKGRISHGMLVASFLSTLVGMYCPGKKNLYIAQKLNFRSPLKLNQKIRVRGEILKKIDSLKIILIKTTVLNEDTILIDGEAQVKVLDLPSL